jgi:two-component system KDP operon response regulator KdpE
MTPARALLLYEDKNRCRHLRAIATCAGCEVDEARFNPEVIALAPNGYGIVLLSVRRPTWRLFEILRTWYGEEPETTLVLISGRTSRANRVAALEAGVSAYLTEPVTVAELAVYLRSALRRLRVQPVTPSQLSFGHRVVYLREHLVRTGEEQVHLTQTECGILEYLVAHPNQTVPCNDLVKSLWGSDPRKGSHSLRCFIRQLRQKLEPDPANPQYLVTDPTNGYRLQIPPASGAPTRPTRTNTKPGNRASREVTGRPLDSGMPGPIAPLISQSDDGPGFTSDQLDSERPQDVAPIIYH